MPLHNSSGPSEVKGQGSGPRCFCVVLLQGMLPVLRRRRADAQGVLHQGGAVRPAVDPHQLPVPAGPEEDQHHRRLSALLLQQGLRLPAVLDRPQGPLHGRQGGRHRTSLLTFSLLTFSLSISLSLPSLSPYLSPYLSLPSLSPSLSTFSLSISLYLLSLHLSLSPSLSLSSYLLSLHLSLVSPSIYLSLSFPGLSVLSIYSLISLLVSFSILPLSVSVPLCLRLHLSSRPPPHVSDTAFI